jgi:antitoxin HicB
VKKNENPHRGSNFDDFLEEEGISAEVNALALKRLVSLQLREIIAQKKVTQTQLASRMHTSTASVRRLLDPDNASLTLVSLGKAAAVLGKKIEVRFVPA